MAKPTSHNENQMIMPGDFFLPFGGKLDEQNRWIQLATMIPWSHAEKAYNECFEDTRQGQEAFNVRMGLGSLIIQERMQLSDRETVESIQENPYMQYFIGLSGFQYKAPFHHSMMTHFRKRLVHVLAKINEIVAMEGVTSDNHDSDDDDDDPQGGRVQPSAPVIEQQEMLFEEEREPAPHSESNDENERPGKATPDESTACVSPTEGHGQADKHELPANQGSLILDATCAPVDVAYPTDLNLLNEAREKLEAIIDTLHTPVIGQERKPRTYRKKARKQYMAVSKKRKPGKKVIRKAVGQQLGYVRRDLKTIARQAQQQSLTLLSRKQYRDLLVIHELDRQQRQMHQQRKHQVEDRIVSIHQPHVRPIVRGKAQASVEFGPKLAVSMIKGYAFLDHYAWDNFNEGTTLIDSVERYRGRMGFYPAVVQVDQIYRTRENRRYCKERGIRISGPALGRPPKDGIPHEQRQITQQDAAERNGIEGKFGEGKRKYGLGHIRARLVETGESVIHLQLLVMNLERRLRLLFCLFFNSLFRRMVFYSVA